MTSIGTRGIGGAGAVGRGAGASGGGATREAMGLLAADVAATVGAELGLAVDPDRQRRPFQPVADLYDVEAVAADLADTLRATPPQAGEIARLLHLFAAAIAARVGAAPDARTLEEVQRLLSGFNEQVTDAPGAIALIGRAVRTLEA